MDQHETLAGLGVQIRGLLAQDDEPAARTTLEQLLACLRPHVAWEEAGLFVRITMQGDFADHITALEAEHAGLYAQLSAAEGDPRGWGIAVTEMLDDLDRHIYSENFGLFPGAIAVLDADDWEEIDAVRPSDCACGGACATAV